MIEKVIIDPSICHGKPVIKGTRVLVSNILADLANGMTYDFILEQYPSLKKEDIQAALEFGSRMASFELID